MTFSSAAVRLLLPGLLGFWLIGCSPLTENELDEQKNPHFLEGKRRANALNQKGAIESFEKALEANPRSASAHLELGLLYEKPMNDHAAAIYHLERHLKLRPQSHVAESVRQRILSCKVELARTVSYALVNQKDQAALDRLTRENANLRQQNDELKAELSKAQAQVLTNRSAPSPSSSVQHTGPGLLTDRSSARTPQPSSSRPTPEASRPASGSAGTYVVKPGETLARISREKGISLDALKAANPGIAADPRRMRPGQVIILPAARN
ncbi:MAG: LysM peptidoglycan-binding domain-containing protein [Verrucomicrobia bacterium]|nr:LysM peptidoglycan-binding domain-containing protein [Verrucomicrobiota bacterium]